MSKIWGDGKVFGNERKTFSNKKTLYSILTIDNPQH